MLKMEVLSTLIVFITIKNQMQFIWILTIFNVLLHKVNKNMFYVLPKLIRSTYITHLIYVLRFHIHCCSTDHYSSKLASTSGYWDNWTEAAFPNSKEQNDQTRRLWITFLGEIRFFNAWCWCKRYFQLWSFSIYIYTVLNKVLSIQ